MTALREVFARFVTQFDDRELRQGDEATSNLTNRLQQLGQVVAGSALVVGIRNFVNTSAAIGDELDKTSRVIGINAGALQAWRHAANLSGVGAESFNTAVTRLQRVMFDAQRGTATALEPFERLGVAFEDAEGQLRPVDEVLRDMADPLNNLESSSERVGILMTVMGRSGARMGPLFDQGSAGIDTMMSRLDELGGGAAQEFVQAAADLTDANADLDLAFLSLRSTLGQLILPVVQRGVEAFTAFVVRIKEISEETKIFQAAAAVLGGVLALKYTPALLGAARAAVGFAVANAPMIASAVLATGVILGLTAVVEDVLVALDGGDSVMGRFTDAVNEFVSTGEGVNALADIWGYLLERMEAVYNFVGETLGFEGAPDERDFTRTRGLDAPEDGFRTNEAADRFNRDEGGGERRLLAERGERILRNRERAAREEAEGEALFTTRRELQPAPTTGLGRRLRVAEPGSVRNNTVQQSNVFNINGATDPDAVGREVERRMNRSLEDAVSDNAGGAGEL